MRFLKAEDHMLAIKSPLAAFINSTNASEHTTAFLAIVHGNRFSKIAPNLVENAFNQNYLLLSPQLL